jgi:hypothetical protein
MTCSTLYISGFINNREKGVIWALTDAPSYAMNRTVRCMRHIQPSHQLGMVHYVLVVKQCMSSFSDSMHKHNNALVTSKSHDSGLRLWIRSEGPFAVMQFADI